MVLQVKRDTAEYVGNGNARAGMMAIDAHLRALSRDIDVGVFLNVDHVDADDDALIDADDLERILAGENPTHRVD